MAVDAASSFALQSSPNDAPSAHPSKDASKRKRNPNEGSLDCESYVTPNQMNRSAKLKQCKLDARREQWLSRCREEKSLGHSVDDCPGEVINPQRRSGSCKQEVLNYGREDGHPQSHLESSLKLDKDNVSPKSFEDRSPKNKLSKFGWDFRTAYSRQEGDDVDLHDSFKSSQDDWEAAADSLGFSSSPSCKETLSYGTSCTAKICNETLIHDTPGVAKICNENLICGPSGMAKTCNEVPICDAVGVVKADNETLACDKTATCATSGAANTCNRMLTCDPSGMAINRNETLTCNPPAIALTCNENLLCDTPGVAKVCNKTLTCDPPGMTKTCNETLTCDPPSVGRTCNKTIIFDTPSVSKTCHETLTCNKTLSYHTLGVTRTCDGTPTCDAPVVAKTCNTDLICDIPVLAKTHNETLTCNKMLGGYTLGVAKTCDGTLTFIKTLTCHTTGVAKTCNELAATGRRLKPAGLSKIRSQSSGASNSGQGKAWKLDDTFRPKSLPNLARQCSFLAEPEPNQGCTPDSLPTSCCPICAEDLDSTDQSFLPCPCGFHLCLFCHHRILLDDGRCPGCRKPYKAASGKSRQNR